MKYISTVEIDLESLTVVELRQLIGDAAKELLRRSAAQELMPVDWYNFIKCYGTISAIKKYREIAHVGLRAAKEFVDSFGVAFVHTQGGTS